MKNYKFEIFTQAIEKNIKSGVYKPGQKLPSVRDFKDYYGLSMSTVQAGFSFANTFEHYFRLVIADKFSDKRIEAIQHIGRYLCGNP